MNSEKPTKWTSPYLDYPIFASLAARKLLERAQKRHSLEDCRIPIWMNLQRVFDEVGVKTGHFQTRTSEDQDMVVQIDTSLKQVHCWLENEGMPPRLENVSLGGSVIVPITEEKAPSSTLH